jgi:hypothetical protein
MRSRFFLMLSATCFRVFGGASESQNRKWSTPLSTWIF